MANIPAPESFAQVTGLRSGLSSSGRILRGLDSQQRFLAASWRYCCPVPTLAGKNTGITDSIIGSGDEDSWLVRIPPFTAFVRVHCLANLDSGKVNGEGFIYIQRVGLSLTGTNDDYRKKISVGAAARTPTYYRTSVAISNAHETQGQHIGMKPNVSGSPDNTPDGDWETARFDVWLDGAELFHIVFEPLRTTAADLDW